jgi:Ala-tRNA(Pro) deacylase
MNKYYEALSVHNVSYEKVDHPPVFTCEDARRLVPDLPGVPNKNLFLKDRKGERYFLIVLGEASRLDISSTGTLLSGGRLSMGSPEDLERILGIRPGSVSLMALINDTDRRVSVIIDEEVWNGESIQCHPGVNTSTLIIARNDMDRFLKALGYDVKVMDLPKLPAVA